ncbi:hypothetical protein NJO91_37550 [Streptomyces microflavus]|uniref:hypothetical protein n=1 Tax=Streptomyces microflavus TaxID=1919 RepID=UPI0029AEADBB|nr:hypothetical protein [Streptomyces microflavus]MDX2408791.1 hypothetical protein [Streptomyces microflavus]
MSAGTAVPPRLARSYTAARRHPWVLGKLGDWVIWFGPYTPAQLVVLGGGALLLIKTFAWWSWLGPVPVVMWLVSVWAVRGAKVAGRSPFAAALGLVQALSQHPAGRIGGRAARDGRPQFLTGSFVVEAGPARGAAVAQAKPVPRAAAVVRQSGPASGLAQLLSGSGSGAVQVRGL